MPYTYDPSEPNDQFPWYARLLGWFLDKVFGTSEGDNEDEGGKGAAR